jgi:outer membrane protein assembly factor BamE (lipoprotein component of BamABCDE complex)
MKDHYKRGCCRLVATLCGKARVENHKLMSWSKFRIGCSTLLVLLAPLAGCATKPQPDLLAKAQSVHVGMAVEQVEALLGKPVYEDGSRLYYGEPVTDSSREAPHQPYQLAVWYDRHHLVQNVRYYEGLQKGARSWEVVPPHTPQTRDLLVKAQTMHVGMTVAQVKALLGKPVGAYTALDFYGERVYYRESEAPFQPFQLAVRYDLRYLVCNVQYFEGFHEGARSWELAPLDAPVHDPTK